MLSGGCLDGEIYDDVNSRQVTDEHHQSTGGWFRQDGDQVQIMNGGTLDDLWLSYKIDIYKKGTKGRNGCFEYKFDRSERVDRCTAKTKSGNLCKKSCYQDLTVCETHK